MDNVQLQQKQSVYCFGVFRLDASERRLWCADEPVALTPKQFDLLFYFVENAGRVAKKTELLDAVWADTYIEENTLARNVSWLRKLLDERAGGEKYIETVPKLGYRFTAEVTRPTNGKNVIIVDEQTVHHLRGEETLTIASSPADFKNSENRQHSDDAPVPDVPPRHYSAIIVATALIMIVFWTGFIVYQNYFKTDSSKGLTVSNTVLFSGAAGNENSPAFSPDSKLLVYSWNGGTGIESDIYVKMIGAGDPLQLTKTAVNEQYPVFSPDGKHIAFVRGKYGEPGEVFIIPLLGGTERRVARMFSGNYSISFSPDGKHIAVVDTESSSPGGQFAIYLVNITTGERHRLTAPAEFDGETTPRFSPDGKSLAFIRSTKNVHLYGIGQHDLFVVSADGGEPRQLTFDGTEIHSLAWSADGKYIYFVPYGPPSQTFLKRIPAGGGDQERVSLTGNDITNIALSPDGQKLIYAENPWLTSIWRVPASGEPAEILNKANVNQSAPHFSPDGSRIVFQSDYTRTLQIWTMDADGRNLRQLTDDSFPSYAPQFSPDGTMIVFNRKEGKDSVNYVIPADGGLLRRLSSPDSQDDYPAWGPDGQYIYFTSRRSGSWNLWKMKTDSSGADAVQITKNGAVFATPSLDGKSVYFRKDGADKELWRIPADGGEEELLTEFTNAGFSGSWIMQETGIYFPARQSDQRYQLKFYDFAEQKIKAAPGAYNIPSNLDAKCPTTDGKVLLCSALENSSHLTLAELQ